MPAQKTSSLIVKIGADTTSFFREIDKTTKALDKAFKPMENVGKTLTNRVTLPLIGIGTALTAVTIGAARTADELETMAGKTGLSIRSLQELKYVSSQTNVEFESLTAASIQLGRNLVSGSDGAKKYADIIGDLGLQTEDASGKMLSMDDLFPQVIEKLSGMEDVTRRNALAVQLFGKGGADLIPMLDAGSGEMDRLIARAHDLNLVMSDDSVKSLADFGDKMDEIKQRVSMAGVQIAEKFLPVIEEDLLPFIESDVIPGIGKFADTVGDVVSGFENLDPAIKTIIGTLGGLVFFSGPLLTVAANIGKIGTAIAAVGVALKANPELLMIAAVAAVGWDAGRDIANLIGKGAAAKKEASVKDRLGMHGQEEIAIFAGQMSRASTGPAIGSPGGGGGRSGGSGSSVEDRLKSLATQIEIVRAKYGLWTLEVGDTATESERLAAELQAEMDEMNLINDRISVMTDAYDALAASKGWAADETQNLYLQLIKERQALLDLEKSAASKGASNDLQAQTIAMIQGRQMELLKEGGGLEGALELQKVLDPNFSYSFADREEGFGLASVTLNNEDSLAKKIGVEVGRQVRMAGTLGASGSNSGLSLREQRLAFVG